MTLCNSVSLDGTCLGKSRRGQDWRYRLPVILGSSLNLYIEEYSHDIFSYSYNVQKLINFKLEETCK